MKLKSIIAAAVALSMSVPAFAASYACFGSVAYLAVDQGGTVRVGIGSPSTTPNHNVCNQVTQGSWTLNTQACKNLYTAALTAKLTGKSISLSYNNAFSCSTLPLNGNVLDIYFVEGPY